MSLELRIAIGFALVASAVTLLACGDDGSSTGARVQDRGSVHRAGDTGNGSSGGRTSSGASAAAQRFGGPSVGLLLRPAQKSDQLPADLYEYLPQVHELELDPTAARRAFSRGGRTLYAIPGRRGICLAVVSRLEGGSGMGCHTAKQWRSRDGGPGRVFTDCTSSSPGSPASCATATLFAVVPDGVRRVAILRNGAPATSVPVRNNVYVTRVSGDSGRSGDPGRGGVRAVRYVEPDGRKVYQRVYVPGGH